MSDELICNTCGSNVCGRLVVEQRVNPTTIQRSSGRVVASHWDEGSNVELVWCNNCETIRSGYLKQLPKDTPND